MTALRLALSVLAGFFAMAGETVRDPRSAPQDNGQVVGSRGGRSVRRRGTDETSIAIGVTLPISAVTQELV